MIKLLDCPFCGGKPMEPKQEGGSDERNGYNFKMVISCNGCDATIKRESVHDKRGWCTDKGEAKQYVIDSWNRRAKE